MDQVWLSPALAPKQTGAFIDRRSKIGGDGSDRDPAWITLTLLSRIPIPSLPDSRPRALTVLTNTICDLFVGPRHA